MTENAITLLLEAAKHASQSIHHPACNHTYPKQCTCHVGKALAALAAAKEEMHNENS